MAKINKRGVFFSLISLFIVFLFVLDFRVASIPHSGESELSLTNTRVKVLNNFINDLEGRYFERILYMASRNALVGLSEAAVKSPPPPLLPIDFEIGTTWEPSFTMALAYGLIRDSSDSDGIPDYKDNCMDVKNPTVPQVDSSPQNGIGDACEAICNDIDGDGICEPTDTDGDGDITDEVNFQNLDNCPGIPNPNQESMGLFNGHPSYGKKCYERCQEKMDTDSDLDGICDNDDNCPNKYNPKQENYNKGSETPGNPFGDACDNVYADGCLNDPLKCVDEDKYLAIGSGGGDGLGITNFKEEYISGLIINEIEKIVEPLGLKINQLEIKNIKITQPDYWHVKVDVDFKYFFTDENAVASWRGKTSKSVLINVEGLNVIGYTSPNLGDLDIVGSSNTITSGWIELNHIGAPCFLDRILRNDKSSGVIGDFETLGGKCGLCKDSTECGAICNFYSQSFDDPTDSCI